MAEEGFTTEELLKSATWLNKNFPGAVLELDRKKSLFWAIRNGERIGFMDLGCGGCDFYPQEDLS